MSESFITLKLSVNDTKRSIRLIEGFQRLRGSKDSEEHFLKEVLNEYFGESFTNTIFAEVKNEEDVLKHQKFIDKKYLNDMEHFMFSLRNRTLNEQRIWQDTYSEALSSVELSPTEITLKTRSVTGGMYWDDIQLEYDSDDCYILKAAVFASAFESSGFDVEELSTNNEYGG